MTKFVLVFAVILALMTAGCSPKEEAPSNVKDTASEASESNVSSDSEPAPLTQAYIDQKVIAARRVADTFSLKLKAELKAAMEHGSAEQAISACNIKAPAISREISASQNMKIRRVSLKNRNVANEPIGWTKKVLEQFEAEKQRGKQISNLEHHELVEINGKHVFRYMKAIPTGDACLARHGSEINPEVTDKLQQLYPDDKAIGFQSGDIRGAFVITEKF